MRVSIKAKQVAGVTAIVTIAVTLVSGWSLASMVQVRLEESQARADMLIGAIYQRARDIVATGQDLVAAAPEDAGMRTILQSSAYAKNVTYAAIVDTGGLVIAHNDEAVVGHKLPDAGDLHDLLAQGPLTQLRAVYVEGGRSFEQKLPLFVGATELGSIRVGISTLLVRVALYEKVRPALITALVSIVGAGLIAMLLAQLVVRPIHVIRSGLARLGRGETDVKVELPQDPELGELGDSFKAVSERLAADKSQLAGQRATLESVVGHLEDAVALFAPDGTLLFANPAMSESLKDATGAISTLWAPDHPYRAIVQETITSREAHGPRTVNVPDAGDRLILTHVVEDAEHRPLGVMLVARNLAYLSQVESTLSYSRKLAALGRLSAGIAHEVKNPLNATMIHLELLKMQLTEQPAAKEHLAVIATQLRRLDEVVQGFLKFTRPEDLKLDPVALSPLFEELMPVIRAEAEAAAIDVTVDCPAGLPDVSADRGMLQQAFLNLALNACQAMPHGGRLRIAAAARPGGRVEVIVEDSGIGIAPENLEHIFDLYFTTKESGSGIGLSMVYRTVQLHGGDIEVESVPGHGTTFRVTLRQA